MDRTAYSRALRAAAQVSFVAAISGCASTAPEGVEPASAANSAKVAPTPTGAASSTPATCADAGGDAKVKSDAAVVTLTCDEKLKAHFPNGDEDWFGNGPRINDPDLAACCGNRLEALKDEDFTGLDKFRTSGCCHVDNVPNIGMACTPWGPPVPPSIADWMRSFKERDRNLEEAA